MANPLAVRISPETSGTVEVICEADFMVRTIAHSDAVDPQFEAAYQNQPSNPDRWAEAQATLLRYPAQVIPCPSCGKEMKTQADWTSARAAAKAAEKAVRR